MGARRIGVSALPTFWCRALVATRVVTPPILPGLEELDSIELAGVSGTVLIRSGHRRAKSYSVIHASSSAKHPYQRTKNLRKAPSPMKSITSRNTYSTCSCQSGVALGEWTDPQTHSQRMGQDQKADHVLVGLRMWPCPPC